MLDIWLATLIVYCHFCISMLEQHQWCQTRLHCNLTNFRLYYQIKICFHPACTVFVSWCIIYAICLLLALSYTSLASTSLQLLRPLKFQKFIHTHHQVSNISPIIINFAVAMPLWQYRVKQLWLPVSLKPFYCQYSTIV